MRANWVRGTVLAVLAAGVATAEPSEKPVTIHDWEAVAASGRVEARPPGDEPVFHHVSRGDRLVSETLLRTGRHGRATFASLAHVVIVDPESELLLPATHVVGEGSAILQNAGSVLYEVDGTRTPSFRVVTPYLIAGVKGTKFLVTVNERYAAVSVDHGAVEITDPSSGERIELRAGETVMRYMDDDRLERFEPERRTERREVRREAERMAKMDERHEAEEREANGKTDAAALDGRIDVALDTKETGASEKDEDQKETDDVRAESLREIEEILRRDADPGARDRGRIAPQHPPSHDELDPVHDPGNTEPLQRIDPKERPTEVAPQSF